MAKPDPLLWGNSTPPTPDEIRHATNSGTWSLAEVLSDPASDHPSPATLLSRATLLGRQCDAAERKAINESGVIL